MARTERVPRKAVIAVMIAVLTIAPVAPGWHLMVNASGDGGGDRLPDNYLVVFHDDFQAGVMDRTKWVHWEGPWSTDNMARTSTGGVFPDEDIYLTESPYPNEFGDPLDDNGNDGLYFPDETAFIETCWIDLKNTTQPRLEFEHRYDIPSQGDGALLFILSDEDTEWALVQPETPYPETTGWSGIVPTWIRVVVRMDEYAGDRIKVRFLFRSSPDGIEGYGWQIDDVVVAGKPDGQLPDLKFGNAKVYLEGYSVTSAVAGDVLEVNMSILNEGRARSGPFVVSAYTGNPLVEGILIGRKLVMEGLGIGFTYFISMSWLARKGEYDLHLTIDELNQVPEENELNNVKLYTLIVDDSSAGDITLLDMRFESEGISIHGAAVGDLVTITATLANLGTSGISTPMVVKAYDGPPAPGKETIGDQQPIYSNLEAGGERPVEIDWRPLEGVHQVFLEVTPQDPRATLDLNDANNLTSATLTVTDSPPIDLVAKELLFIVGSSVSTVASEGDHVRMLTTVSNDGTAAFIGLLEVSVFRGDPEAGGVRLGSQVIVGELRAGSSLEVSIDWLAELGTHAITVFVDPDNLAYEYDEDNNQLAKGLTVSRRPLPDLTVSSLALLLNGVELDPSTGTNEGANVEVNITVRNLGNDDTKGEVITTLYLGNPLLLGTAIGSFKVPEGLNPDEVFTGSIHWKAVRPSQKSRIPVLFVMVDSAKTEREVNEFDNIDMRMLPVGESLPDLTFTKLTITDDDGQPIDHITYGVEVTLRFTITNVGTDISFQVANVDLFLDDTEPESLIASVATSTLGVGEWVDRSLTWKPDPLKVGGGMHTILAYVDSSDDIRESSDANNMRSADLEIDATARPNLLVMDIAVAKGDRIVDSIDEGKKAHVTVRVLNLGNAPLYTPSTVELFHGDPIKGGEPIGSWQLTGLPISGTVTYEADWTFERDLPLMVIIDRTNSVRETNENDNVGILNVEVIQPSEGADYVTIGAVMAGGVLVVLALMLIIRRRALRPPEAEPEEVAEISEEKLLEPPTEAEVPAEAPEGVEGEGSLEEAKAKEEVPSEEAGPPAETPPIAEAEEAPPAESAPAPTPRCPNCGEEIDADWILCPNCETALK